jgi:hypothetical protein
MGSTGPLLLRCPIRGCSYCPDQSLAYPDCWKTSSLTNARRFDTPGTTLASHVQPPGLTRMLRWIPRCLQICLMSHHRHLKRVMQTRHMSLREQLRDATARPARHKPMRAPGSIGTDEHRDFYLLMMMLLTVRP